MQESPGRKSDWLDDKSFSFENLYSSLNKILSKILANYFSKYLCIKD